MANQVEITITADPSAAAAGFKKVKSGFQSVKASIIKNRKAIGVGPSARDVVYVTTLILITVMTRLIFSPWD